MRQNDRFQHAPERIGMTANGPFRTPEHLFTNGSFRFDGNTEAMILRRYLRQRGVENPTLGYFCGGVRKGS